MSKRERMQNDNEVGWNFDDDGILIKNPMTSPSFEKN
jgi:hypothetical protein